MFNFEFQIIEFIQKFRTPLLDEFFKLFNFFDRKFFIFILIPMIWIGYNRKLGIKLFFILMINFIVNHYLKNLFMLPRPSHIDPILGVIQLKSYSFPSGGAQTAVLIPLIFINHFKNKKWPIIVGACYFFFKSLSRMYLGAHFLSDLIAGSIIGFLLFLIYLYIFPNVEKHVIKKPVFSFWIYQGVILLFLFIPGFRFMNVIFTTLGVFLGLFLSFELNMFLDNTKNLKEFFFRSSLAVFGVFALYYLYYFFHEKLFFLDLNIIYYLMGFWISFLCSFIYKKVFLKLNIPR